MSFFPLFLVGRGGGGSALTTTSRVEETLWGNLLTPGRRDDETCGARSCGLIINGPWAGRPPLSLLSLLSLGPYKHTRRRALLHLIRDRRERAGEKEGGGRGREGVGGGWLAGWEGGREGDKRWMSGWGRK